MFFSDSTFFSGGGTGRWVTRSFLFILALALIGCAPSPGTDPPRASTVAADTAVADTAAELEVRFLDVGQGDAILIRSRPAGAAGSGGGDRVALVDAGPANRIVGQLRALGVQHLDLMVASHNHADHIGGMDAILDSIPLRFYLDNGHPANTQIQRRVLERVEAKGVTYLEPTGRSIRLGDAQLHILPAPEGVGGEEQNNRSVSVVVERGTFRALLTGDSETELINALLATGDIPEVDVLKAAHHGSRNGVTPGWLARTQPDLVVISVAARNNYGHPHAAALRYYCAGGRRVLRTDLHGDVIITVNHRGEYSVTTEKQAAQPEACAA